MRTFGFWSSDILTGSQTFDAGEYDVLWFWSSDILTGSQTDASKKMNQTRSYADLKNGVEPEVLKSSTSINTLNGYLKDTSKKKKNATSIVFDNFNNQDLDDDDLVGMLKETRSFSRGRVYVLTKKGG